MLGSGGGFWKLRLWSDLAVYEIFVSNWARETFRPRHTVLMEKVQITAMRRMNVRAVSRKLVEFIELGGMVILADVALPCPVRSNATCDLKRK